MLIDRDVCFEIFEQKKGRMIDTTDKIKAREEICNILDCLLNQEEINCKKCKDCEKLDACCFLSEAIFVCQYKKFIKNLFKKAEA
jgi:hypothetical protein